MIKRLLSYLSPHRKRFGLALFAMVLFGASDGAIPLLLKYILDDVFGSHNEQMLWLLVGLILVLAVSRAVFGFMQRYLSETVGLKVVEELRNQISRKLLSLSPSFYGGTNTGALISRMTNDTLLVRHAITDASVGFLRDSIRLIALVAAALWLDPFLGIIAFVALPVGIIPIVRFGKKVRRLSRSGQEQLGGLTSVLHEIIIGHKVVQSYRMEPFEAKRFADENASSTRSFIKAAKYGALSGPTNELLACFAIATIILYGGYSVMNGTRTQGDFMAFITAMLLMYEPLKRFSRLNNTIQIGIAAAERIFEVVDLPADVQEAADAKELSCKQPRIVFDQVGFEYKQSKEHSDAQQVWAVQDISFTVEPGNTLALIGTSGSGKSTLVNLLPRFYDPQQGRITVDGIDTRQCTLDSLRSHIAIVDQHTFLFDASVHHNIAYGRLDVSRADVERAAEAANAHGFIQELPAGYDTKIGEQGLRLSGGQRARMAIARALLQDAPILILDEATASLDSHSEKLVQDAIDRLMIGRTVLVIAHRLSTVRSADMLVVLKDGRIVEKGNHDQLLAQNGEYARLYNLQFLTEPKAEPDKEVPEKTQHVG